MRASLAAFLLLCASLVTGSSVRAQDVVVNGQVVTNEQMQAIQQRLGIPETAPIPPGRYWYDRFSGLWGMEGGPTMGQILPELDLGGPLQPDASGSGTGVFINGRELHLQEVAFLQQLFGYVIPGRYWLDWQGIGGFEGGPAAFNLRAAAQQAGAGGVYGGSTRRTPFGSTGSDGNCSYYMHPNGSSVMNCGGG
jgi:hypothetical protein